MAFGLTPNYTQIIPAEHLTENDFYILLVETANKMDWTINLINKNEIEAFTNQGMFNWNASVTISVENNAASIKSTSTGSEMFDWGKNKKTVEQFISTFNELKNHFSTEELSEKYLKIEEHWTRKSQTLPITPQKNFGFFSIFIPVKGYFITPILININITIFIIMLLSGVSFIAPDTEDLISWGANFRPVTLEGEWWRLFTNCFLHIGVIHLLMNMYALMYIGILLEPYLGKIRFLSAYLLTGLLASITSLWWHDLTVSAGASGAIFGMYGVFLVLLTTNLIEEKTRKALLTSIGIFVGYNLLFGLKGGIDNAAHIGGLCGGLIIGYAFTFDLDVEGEQDELSNDENVEFEEGNLKFKIIGILTIIFVFISIIVYRGLTNDIVVYDKKMNQFKEMETLALEVYKKAKYEPKDRLLYDIKDRGIYYWNENINLINELDKLNLPKEIHQKNAKIIKYCELRIKSYDCIYKSISENTDKYNNDIEYFDNEIKAILNELKN